MATRGYHWATSKRRVPQAPSRSPRSFSGNTGTLNDQLASSVPVPPCAGIGVSRRTRTSVVPFQRACTLSVLMTRPLATMRERIIPSVSDVASLNRGECGANMFWSSRMAMSRRSASLMLVILTVSVPETMPVAGSSLVSIE